MLFPAPTFLSLPAFVFLLFCNSSISCASDSREDRIFNAAVEIYYTQIVDGEALTIPAIQMCYQEHVETGAGLTPDLEKCIAMDMAYTKYSSDIYHMFFGDKMRPEYTKPEVMLLRVKDFLHTAGLDKDEAENEIRYILELTLSFEGPAVEKAMVEAEKVLDRDQ